MRLWKTPLTCPLAEATLQKVGRVGQKQFVGQCGASEAERPRVHARVNCERANAMCVARISQRVEVLELVDVDEEVLLAVTLDVALELLVAVWVAVEDLVTVGLPDADGEVVEEAVDDEVDVALGVEVELACRRGEARRSERSK